jgi:hypothetical protein
VRVDIDAGSTELEQRSTRMLLRVLSPFDLSVRGPNAFLQVMSSTAGHLRTVKERSSSNASDPYRKVRRQKSS